MLTKWELVKHQPQLFFVSRFPEKSYYVTDHKGEVARSLTLN